MFHKIKRSSSRQSAGPDIDDDDQNKVERIFFCFKFEYIFLMCKSNSHIDTF